jgi:hypothetical protein
MDADRGVPEERASRLDATSVVRALRAVASLAFVADACVGSGAGMGSPRAAPAAAPTSVGTTASAVASESPAGHPPPRGPRIRLSSLRGRVAFDCGNDVCVANVDGSDVRNLTNRSGAEFDPTWAPDGSRVAYRDSRRGTNNDDEIFVVNADGTGLHQVPIPGCGGAFSDPQSIGCFAPGWSPDGTRIVFSRASAMVNVTNIYTANPDGSGLFQVTHESSGLAVTAADWGTHPLAH